MTAKTGLLTILLGALVFLVFACQSFGANPGGATPAAGAPEPTDPTMVEVPAPIDGVETSVAESFPPQYFLAVTSGLPNGCIRFGGYDVERDGDTINVTVTNLEPADKGLIACTALYGLVETNIARAPRST